MGPDQADGIQEHIHTDPGEVWTQTPGDTTHSQDVWMQPDTQGHSPGCQQPVNQENNLWYKDRVSL